MFGRLFVNVSGGQLPMANNCPPSEYIKEETITTAIHYSLRVPAHQAGFELSSGSVENSNSTMGEVEAHYYSVLHVFVQATETRPLISSQRLAVLVYIMMCPHQTVHCLRVLSQWKSTSKIWWLISLTCATTQARHTPSWKDTTQGVWILFPVSLKRAHWSSFL